MISNMENSSPLIQKLRGEIGMDKVRRVSNFITNSNKRQKQTLIEEYPMHKPPQHNKSLTQKVLAYEINKLKIKHEQAQGLVDHDHGRERYSQWSLPAVLNGLSPPENIVGVKWLGYDADSHIYSILFCLLKGCIESSRIAEAKGTPNQDYIYLKYFMYKLASEHLKQPQQKILVQLLSSAQYSNDISKFLCKYRSLQRIFAIMFRKYLRLTHSDTTASDPKVKMENLLQFCHHKFPFVGFKLSRQSETNQEELIAIFVVAQVKMYIVECHGCFFVVEMREGSTHETPRKSIHKIRPALVEERIEEEDTEDLQQFQDIQTGRRGNQESSEKISSFGKGQKLEYSTPKFILRTTYNTEQDRRESKRETMDNVNVHGFDQTEKAKNYFEQKSPIREERGNQIKKNTPSVKNLQSLIDRLKNKKFRKSISKQKRNTMFKNPEEEFWRGSISPSKSKNKSLKRYSAVLKKTGKQWQSKGALSPTMSPPLSPIRSPLTIYSPTRPSSQYFCSRSGIMSPKRDNKVVFTYAASRN